MSADDSAGESEDDHLSADALASAVRKAKSVEQSKGKSAVARRDRRRAAGPFSVRASTRIIAKGEVLTLRNMFVAFHHPESGGQYSSSIHLAGPGVLSLFVVAGAVAAGTYSLLPYLGVRDLATTIIATVILVLLAMLLERFYAHRQLEVQVSGGNFAIYRNGRKKPFVLGPAGDLKLSAYGPENYRRVRFLFPMKSFMAGNTEHDIYLEPVPSDTADMVNDFARRMGVED